MDEKSRIITESQYMEYKELKRIIEAIKNLLKGFENE